MQSLDIEYLLAELKDPLMAPSEEAIRPLVMQTVRYLFCRIGLRLVGYEECSKETFVKGRLRLPADFLRVEDISTGPHGSIVSRDPIKFIQTPFEIQIQHRDDCDDVRELYVFAHKFYKGENGELIIPEAAYTACFDYCMFKGIVSPSNPHWQSRLVTQQKAEQEIAIARGFLNESTRASNRRMRNLL